jgi:hypothetical protein
MLRSAARRKERSNYTLDITISALGNAATLPPVQNDYADGLQGGPDYWDVTLADASRRLNIHASASSSSQVLGKVSNGAVLRNRGCRMAEGRRWCSVVTVKTPRVSGWIVGQFLRESSYTGTPAKSYDALVPGTKFNATGNIPCARHVGQPMAACRFGVVRKGQGNGTLTVFWPNGGTQVIFFEHGSPASFDRSQSDGNVRMKVDRKADILTVTIGPQRFEIPDAVMMGG